MHGGSYNLQGKQGHASKPPLSHKRLQSQPIQGHAAGYAHMPDDASLMAAPCYFPWLLQRSHSACTLGAQLMRCSPGLQRLLAAQSMGRDPAPVVPLAPLARVMGCRRRRQWLIQLWAPRKTTLSLVQLTTLQQSTPTHQVCLQEASSKRGCRNTPAGIHSAVLKGWVQGSMYQQRHTSSLCSSTKALAACNPLPVANNLHPWPKHMHPSTCSGSCN